MRLTPRVLIILFCFHFSFFAFAQNENNVIRTKDGQSLGPKRAFVALCKKAYGAPSDNQLVTKICDCEASLLDQRYTMKQIRNYEKKYGNGLWALMQEDTLLQRQKKECSAGSEHLLLLTIPGYRKSFIDKCVDNLKLKSMEPINDTLAAIFCNCAANVMEKRKVTLERFEELAEPSSFLYNEIAYKCGSPFLKSSDFTRGWKAVDSMDILGQVSTDSVQMISLFGMHKIRITIGGITKIWMLDSGASDLLLSEEYANELKAKGFLSEMNYMGEGLYSLADNRTISCKRYKVNNVKIGKFSVNNVVLSVSKHANQFLLGKGLLNKFTQWTLDNKGDWLILKK